MQTLPEYVILWILQRLPPADRCAAAATCRQWAAVADWPEAWDDLHASAQAHALKAALGSATCSVDRARAAIARLRVTPGLLCDRAPEAARWPIRAGNVAVALWFAAEFGKSCCRDISQYVLPWACREGRMDMIEAMCRLYPPDEETLKRALEAAAAGAHSDATRWMLARTKPTAEAAYYACLSGRVDFVRDFFAPIDWGAAAYWDVGAEDLNGHTPPEDELSELTLARAPERTFVEVCRRGHLKMARWLASDPLLNVCPAVRRTAVLAASVGGHLPVVAWLVEKTRHAAALTDEAMESAAAGGHTELLYWMFDYRRGGMFLVGLDDLPTRNLRSNLLAAACSAGQLATARWLVDTARPRPPDSVLSVFRLRMVQVPLANNRLDIVQWAVGQFPTGLFHSTVQQALGNARSLEAIRWLVSLCADDLSMLTVQQLVRSACGRGDLETVEWLAAEYKVNLTAHEAGVGSPLQITCMSGHYDLARWIAARCDRAYVAATAQAVAKSLCYGGRDDIVKWFAAEGWLPDDEAPQLFWRACEGGELQLARRLREQYRIRWEDFCGSVPRYPDLRCHVREWLRVTYPECCGVLPCGEPLCEGGYNLFEMED